MRKRPGARVAAGGAMVQACLMAGHRFSIGAAAVEATLPALCLGQKAVETVGESDIHVVWTASASSELASRVPPLCLRPATPGRRRRSLRT